MGRKQIHQFKNDRKNIRSKITEVMGYSLLVFLMIYPWVTYAVHCSVSAEEKNVYIQKIEEIIDTCLFGKMYLLLVFSLLLFVCICIFIVQNRGIIVDRNTQEEKVTIHHMIYAGTAIFVLLALLSAGLSEFPKVSLWGSYNNPEGLFVILAYIVLAIGTFVAFQNKEIWHKARYIVMFLAVITIILSFIEFYVCPVTRILYPEGWQTDYENMVSLTFFNSGYYGGFVILLFPLVMGLLEQAKRFSEMIFLSFQSVGLFVCVLLSKSTGAFYVAVFEIVCFMLYGIYVHMRYRRTIVKWKLKLVCLAGILAVLTAADLITAGSMRKQLLSTAANETEDIRSKDYQKITDIDVDGSVLCITSVDSSGQDKTLEVILNQTQLVFRNQETQKIADMTQDGSSIYFQGEFEGIRARMENNALTFNYGYKGDIRFYIYENTFYPMLSDGSLVQDISGGGLKGGDFIHTATGRGYMWINTLPILKNSIIVGQGPATFGLYFKQFDFVGLLNSQGTVDLFIDKPHSMYLQTAEQTGVISALIMVAVLILIMVCAIGTQRNYIRSIKEDKSEWNLVPLMIAVSGFAILGLVNDSCITVNPIFWIMVGALYAGTRKAEKFV